MLIKKCVILCETIVCVKSVMFSVMFRLSCKSYPILYSMAYRWHFHSLTTDKNGPWDGPAAEDWFHWCGEHGIWHCKGHLDWWVGAEPLRHIRDIQGEKFTFCVFPLQGNVTPVNIKVSAPSSRNLGRFQVVTSSLSGQVGLLNSEQFRITVTDKLSSE